MCAPSHTCGRGDGQFEADVQLERKVGVANHDAGFQVRLQRRRVDVRTARRRPGRVHYGPVLGFGQAVVGMETQELDRKLRQHLLDDAVLTLPRARGRDKVAAMQPSSSRP